MIYKNIEDVQYASERALIINVHTRLCTTLALLSVLKYAKIPTLLIDCSYNNDDTDYHYFEKLQANYNFDLLSLPLQQHGYTLDYIFNIIKSDKLLLIDSDLELLDDKIVPKMLELSNSTGGGETFGCGYVHGPCKLDLNSFYGTSTEEKGLYMERMWIPFSLLNVAKIKEALNAGKSFIDKKSYNIVPVFPRLSKFLYTHCPKICEWSIIKKFQCGFGNNKSKVVYYDTGAEIFEYLKNEKYYFFFGDRYESFVHEKHMHHYEGVTRKLLLGDKDNTAFDVRTVKDFLINRLKSEYNFDYTE